MGSGRGFGPVSVDVLADDPRDNQDVAVRIANAFIANHAEVREGIANVLGGFPEWWMVPTLPQQVVMFVVVDLLVEDGEMGIPFEFSITLERPDRSTMPIGIMRMQRDRGPLDPTGVLHHNVAVFPAPINIGSEGTHLIGVQGSGHSMQIPIYVRRTQIRGASDTAATSG
jgi:hypothetical protein